MDSTVNLIKGTLQKRNLKVTKSRISLLNELYQYDGAMPMSAIQKALVSTDRVTLYRTIQTLKENGIIHNAMIKDGEMYYALCGSTCTSGSHVHNHVHFRCVKCDTVSCQNLDQSVEISLPNFDIHKIDITLEGICRHCITLN